MFKEILSGFNKFFSREKIIILVVFFILGYALLSYSGSKNNVFDRMENGNGGNTVNGNTVSQSSSVSSSGVNSVNGGGSGVVHTQPSKVIENPSDLLPKDKNSQWTALNPVTVGSNNVMPDLLQAGHHIGLDTIGQTLKNANLQLRSDPYIAKTDIGPWMQSTIEPDLGRVPLEIGYGGGAK
jgi:hypothetical protein